MTAALLAILFSFSAHADFSPLPASTPESINKNFKDIDEELRRVESSAQSSTVAATSPILGDGSSGNPLNLSVPAISGLTESQITNLSGDLSTLSGSITSLNSSKVSKAGDTMTGSLIVNAPLVLSSSFSTVGQFVYFASPDSVSTYTAVIQAAINAYSTVYFASGTYLIDNTIKFNNGTRLIGSGKDTTFFRYTGSTVAFVTLSTGVRTYSQTFEGFTVITGTASGTTAFLLDSVSRSNWSNVVADGFGVGWDLYSPIGGYSVYNRFWDCMAQNIGRVNTSTGGAGAYLHGNSTNANKFYAFRANNFTYTGTSTGAWIANSNENTFEGSQFETNNAGVGVWLTANRDSLSDSNVIAFTRFEMANSTGIVIGADVGGTQIHGNYPTGITAAILDSGYATNIMGGNRSGAVNGTVGAMPQFRVGKAIIADSFVAGSGVHSYDPTGCVIVGSSAFNGCGSNFEVEGTANFGQGVYKSTFNSIGSLTLATGANLTMSGATSPGFSRFYDYQNDNETQFPAIELHKGGTGDLMQEFQLGTSTWLAGVIGSGNAVYSGHFVIGRGSPGDNTGTWIIPSTAAYLDITPDERVRVSTLSVFGSGGAKVVYGLITATATVTSTMTVMGNAFSVGLTTFAINGGSATLAYQFAPGSISVTGSTGTIVNQSSITANTFFGASTGLTGASSITGLGAQVQALNLNSHLINNVTDPTSAQDAATKNYVDLSVSSVDYRAPCRLGTTAALPSSNYANGSSGVGATITGISIGLLSVDSVNPAIGDRVLVKNETSQLRNGIYTVTANSSLVVFILTRATDFDSAAEMGDDIAVMVASGTVNAINGNDPSTWVTISSVTTVGTDAVNFTEIEGPGTVTGNAAITVTNSTGTFALSLNSSSATLQGNTFNGASQLVQLNGSTQYPAKDGSLITSMTESQIANLTTDLSNKAAIGANGDITSLTALRKITSQTTITSSVTINSQFSIATNARLGDNLTIQSSTGPGQYVLYVASQDATALLSLTGSGGLSTATGTFTATGNTQYSVKTSSGINVGAGGVVAAWFGGSLAGNAATATALAANGSNCSSGSAPLGVDASGNAETCTAYLGATATAGGDLSGNYPNPTVGPGITNAVTFKSSVTINSQVSISTPARLGEFTIQSSTGPGQYVIFVASQNATALFSLTGSGGLSAATGTFTATGNTQYSVVTSSGVSVGAGGVTATFLSGAHYGDGSKLTNLTTANVAAGTFAAAVLLPAGNLTAGPVNSTILPSTVAYTSVANTFSATLNTFTYNVSAGSIAVTNGLTASSGTFTATGNTQYSVVTSSGIKMQNNGCLVFGDSTLQCSAASGSASGGNAGLASTQTFSGGDVFLSSVTISTGAQFIIAENWTTAGSTITLASAHAICSDAACVQVTTTPVKGTVISFTGLDTNAMYEVAIDSYGEVAGGNACYWRMTVNGNSGANYDWFASAMSAGVGFATSANSTGDTSCPLAYTTNNGPPTGRSGRGVVRFNTYAATETQIDFDMLQHDSVRYSKMLGLCNYKNGTITQVTLYQLGGCVWTGTIRLWRKG